MDAGRLLCPHCPPSFRTGGPLAGERLYVDIVAGAEIGSDGFGACMEADSPLLSPIPAKRGSRAEAAGACMESDKEDFLFDAGDVAE